MKLTSLALLPLALTLACSGATTAVGASDAAPPPEGDSGATTTPPVGTDAGEAAAPDAATTPTCASYAKGPYGTGVGQVLPPNDSWQGYAANDASVTTLQISDLYDCDRSKGINAIVIDTSAGWCAACETQAHDEAELMAEYDQLGVKAITLIIMDAAEQPATTATALDWRTTYNLDDVGVYADPNFLLEPQNQQTIGLPLTMIVDPRTMKVVKATEGYGQEFPPVIDPTLEGLAKQNHP